MELTVAICSGDDMRIFSCIASIDEPFEIVCGITPNEEIEARLTEMGIRYAVVEEGSHSAVSNAAISLVRTECFLLMDSDCTFVPGALRLFHAELQNASVVKGRIKFLHKKSSYVSFWISRCRNFDNIFQSPLYKPGLGLRREIEATIGGWFNEDLKSTVDAELGFRVEASSIKPAFLDAECVLHAPVSFRHNIRSYLAYGRGDFYRYHQLGQRNHDSQIRYEFARHREFIRKEGLAGLPILLFNDLVYYAGFFQAFLQSRFQSSSPCG